MLSSILAILIALVVLAGMAFMAYFLVKKGLSLVATKNSSDTAGNTTGSSVGLPTLTNSLTFRAIAVAVLGLVMLIPLALVSDVVRERNYLYESVLNDIAASWGHRQDIRGPMLVVPFTESWTSVEVTKDDKGKRQTTETQHRARRHAIILPQQLDYGVSLDEEYRNRGIYESLVYTANVSAKGYFPQFDIGKLTELNHEIHWQKAFVSFGVSDTRAISEANELALGERKYAWSPGSNVQRVLPTGFHAPVDLSSGKSQPFTISFTLKGSDGLYLAPLGETTNMQIDSSWAHPSFQGVILPKEYKVSDDGFNANWTIPHLARNYPQQWVLETSKYDTNDMFTTGVRLFEPVFLYSLVERAVKYGLLFIALTFMTFLVFELGTAVRLHYVQYGLVGAALALFYLVLLSLAEHIAFQTAYASAAGIAIGMISIYIAAALKSVARALFVCLLLVGLYALLYSILHMEDYALLMGTGLLLVVIIALMVVTRNLRGDSSANSSP